MPEPVAGEGDGTTTVSKADFERAMNEEKARIDRLTQALDTQKEHNIRLDERLKTQVETPPAPPVYTEAQLTKAVEEGTITEAAKAQILQEQRDQQVDQRIQSEVDRRVTQESQRLTVSEGLKQYKEKIPDLMVDGSEARKRVKTEYDFLVSVDGPPKTKADELLYDLKAARAAFGPVEKVVETTKKTQETHKETGGPGGSEPEETDEAPKEMTGDEKKHYTRLIEQGIYKDWDAVKAEYKYKQPKVRRA